ncbi:MAG: hypothetical protein LAN61_14430 [Acidobacteriia bacterium]|nr:hypothetical protein [Terriglobia bacterium]
MAFGHNSNAVFDGTTYHVQTESRGVEHPIIDSMVYFKGRVMHRRKNGYEDLLPLTPEHEAVLQQRVDAQHLAIVEEIRSGALKLDPGTAAAPKPAPAPPAAPEPQELHLEVLNPRNWLAGGRAHLKVRVSLRPSQTAVARARVAAQIEGVVTPLEFVAETGPDGNATLDFPMPRLGGGEAVLALQATHGGGSAHVRFQLRAKSKPPAAQ